MKIEVDYDPDTGDIKNASGGVIGNCHGLRAHKTRSFIEPGELLEYKRSISVSELKELKDAGYTAHEISELRSNGVL